LIAFEVHRAHIFTGVPDVAARFAAAFFISGAAVAGMLLATYTGVLLGATVIPAWFLHRALLPIHFGTAALGSAAAMLELLGHRVAVLNVIGLVTAGVETILMIWLTLDRHGAADRACHHGSSGWLIRISEILTGPISLVARLLGWVPVAGISFLIGSLLGRFGWLSAGKVSGADPEAALAAQR